MGRILVVVYSCAGTSRRLAQLLAALQRWPLGEIRDACPPETRTGWWRRAADSLWRRCPPIIYDGPDPRGFDAVVLVSRVSMHRLAAPMRSFVAMYGGQLHDVAVVSVMRRHGAAQAVAEIARLVGRAPVRNAAYRTRDIEDGTFARSLEAFGREVHRAEARAAISVRAPSWSAQAG